MHPALIVLIVLIVVALLFGIILLVLGIIFHNVAFNKRFTPDPLVTNYEIEDHLKKEEVSFNIGKYKAYGYYVSNDKAKDDVILVYLHGMWSFSGSYNQDINYLANNYFKVFTFDYLGTDKTEGKLFGLASGLRCADLAIKYVKENNPGKKIYVCGHSWGAFNTINVTQFNEVDKIVALAPFLSIKDTLKSFVNNPILKFLCNLAMIKEYQIGFKYAKSNSLKSLKNYKGKALVIHSTADPVLSYEKNTKLLENNLKNKDNVKFVIMDNKGHQPHYSLESLALMMDYFNKSKGLGGKELDALKKSTDFLKMGELDKNIMDQIVNFLND